MNEKLADPRDIAIIPILDGTNYGHWSLQMKRQLRSKDLLEVCDKTVPCDANTTITNKWCKASYEEVNLITSRMSELVFQEVVNPETIEKAHLLWTKITERYASKRAVNRGRFIENLTLNEDLIEKPEEILIRLQYYKSADPRLWSNAPHVHNQNHSNSHSNSNRRHKSNLKAVGIGTAHLLCNKKNIKLENALLVPDLKCNLISMLELFKKQIKIAKKEDYFKLSDDKEEILRGRIINRLMIIEHKKPKNLFTQIRDIPWHERLGHPNINILKILNLPITTEQCVICDLNKSQQLPFTHHFEPAIYVLDCLHMDLVGPINPPSISQCKFFLTITNQELSYKIVSFLKNKSECFEKSKTIKKENRSKTRKKNQENSL
ncbi:hypothetical protein O181_110077 [Austropuccinia psidii MF-1]|uniref:Retrovirus-related Pol polyprotein from transposon TNT 1-94-like beta-barrel domain-containing protein n=1 Tax=Austropuccinia psidii MF-1 TaxID=1389203 RepID=A0A9Q3JZ29_9BASI|nr:hypothetical protein [Austropuccinia psidii MF-1]